MSLHLVPSGRAVPDDIYVIIEIPAQSTPIKYEVDKSSGELFVDRLMPAPMFYPCNYGYINKTLSEDGDPLDVLVPTPHPLHPRAVIRCRPVGILRMTDESGEDTKVVAVPHGGVTQMYDNIQDINDLPNLLKEQIKHFFEHYKSLESGKWAKVEGWGHIDAARSSIIEAIQRAKESK